jgi:hypothetical protein
LDAAVLYDQFANADGKFEATGTGAAGIEIEDSVARLLIWDVTVAADHNCEAGGSGIEVQFCQIVEDVDREAACFKHLDFGQLARPRSFVDVATYGGDGSNRGESWEDFWRADVAGVDDALRSAQGFDGFGAKQAVSVGDDADDKQFSVLSSQFSVLSSQFSVLSSQFSVLSS